MTRSFAAGLVLSLALGISARASDVPARPAPQASDRPSPASPPPPGHAIAPSEEMPAPAAGTVLAPSEGHAAGENGAGVPDNGLYGQQGRGWARLEYLWWHIKDAELPPLLTTGTPEGLGLLGQPGTRVLIGGSVDYGGFSGGRLTGGYWLDCGQTCGVEASGFFLGEESIPFIFSSAGQPILVRPFFNAQADVQDAEQVANPLIPDFPNLLPTSGAVQVETFSRLWGWELSGVKKLYCGSNYRLDLLGGFRYLRLDEGVGILEHVEIGPNDIDPDVAGTRFILFDDFGTRNDFYGVQLGARLELRYDCWFVDFRTVLGVGATHKIVDIEGFTVIDPPGGSPQQFFGGLLALPSNIGHFDGNVFSFAPEVRLNVGCQLTNRLRGYVGYTFLYWSNVVRPADQISLRLDPSQLPPNPAEGAKHPSFSFESTGFWAQGFNVGLEFRY